MTAKLCSFCNTRRPKTGSKGSEISPNADMCNYCFEEGGHENQHGDRGHERISAEVTAQAGFTTTLSEEDRAEHEDFMPGCWICHPELNLAKLPAKAASTAPKGQVFRRPQLNHKGHSHPQTPAARRACKAAFWQVMGGVANVASTNQIAEAMERWDAKFDGNGKPIAWHKEASPERKLAETAGLVKPATWTVAPRGPKGGVINQLKASKPKTK